MLLVGQNRTAFRVSFRLSVGHLWFKHTTSVCLTKLKPHMSTSVKINSRLSTTAESGIQNGDGLVWTLWREQTGNTEVKFPDSPMNRTSKDLCSFPVLDDTSFQHLKCNNKLIINSELPNHSVKTQGKGANTKYLWHSREWEVQNGILHTKGKNLTSKAY